VEAAEHRSGWDARLELGFSRIAQRTVVSRRRHHGPLLIQRPFYPEQDGTCHVYILHPPGGVVAGDTLSLDVEVEAEAAVLITTPAATKFYRSSGLSGRQLSRLTVASGARLEWLPQETIVFDGARADIQTRVELAADAHFLGWDMLCLGRPAAAERYLRGHTAQRFEVYRSGRPLWVERASYAAGGELLDAPWGLAGHPVVGSLVCAAAQVDGLLEQVRRAGCELARECFAATHLDGVLVCRYLGESAEQGRAAFEAVWTLLRASLWDSPASPPRIWLT